MICRACLVRQIKRLSLLLVLLLLLFKNNIMIIEKSLSTRSLLGKGFIGLDMCNMSIISTGYR